MISGNIGKRRLSFQLTRAALFILTLALSVGALAVPVKCDNNTDGLPWVSDDRNSAAYSVKAVLPENHEGSSSYFNLRMEPGQKQTVSVEVTSLSTASHTIYVSLANGGSNSNGDIDYLSGGQTDPSLIHPFTEIAKAEATEFILPAGESVVVDIALSMPENPFDGRILGGIHFLRKAQEDDGDEALLKNDFAYLLGIVLFENDSALPSNFELAQAAPQVVNYQPALTCSIRNTRPIIEKNMNIWVSLYYEGSLVLNHERSNLSFAPNSRMDYNVQPVDEFKPGWYRAVIQLSKADGTSWEYEYDFTIDGDNVEMLAAQAAQPFEAVKEISLWVYLAVAAGITWLLIFIIAIIYREKEKKRRRQQRMDRITYKK